MMPKSSADRFPPTVPFEVKLLAVESLVSMYHQHLQASRVFEGFSYRNLKAILQERKRDPTTSTIKGD